MATRVKFSESGGNLEDRADFWVALGVREPMLQQALLVNPVWHPGDEVLAVSRDLGAAPIPTPRSPQWCATSSGGATSSTPDGVLWVCACGFLLRAWRPAPTT